MINTFADLLNNIGGVFNALIFLIISLALVYFLYGIAKYILRYGDESARNESIRIMTHGLIALFVMFAVWGLTELVVSLIGGRLGIPQIGG